MVKIEKIFHKGNFQIAIYFGFSEELKCKARSIGASWSQTNKCWYVLYNKDNYNLIKLTFEDIEIINGKNDQRHTEPAVAQQEIVHIAEDISEIQPTLEAEHKGEKPEFASKILYLGTSGKYWLLKVPYLGGITPKLMDIKGVYWNKSQKAFFVLRHINVKSK